MSNTHVCVALLAVGLLACNTATTDPELSPREPSFASASTPSESAPPVEAPPPEPTPTVTADGCRIIDLDAWAAKLNAANGDPERARALVREAGLVRNEQVFESIDDSKTDLKVEARVESVELDGSAPAEVFVEARLTVPWGVQRVLAAVFVRDGERWCPTTGEELGNGTLPRPHESPPDDPDFRGPAEFAFVPLLAPDRMVIEQRIGMGSDSSDPLATNYGLQYIALEGRELRSLFVITLYSAMTSTYIDDPVVTATVEPFGEFPRQLRTLENTDCGPLRASCRRNPEACESMDVTCKPGRVERVWTYVDGSYTLAKSK